MKEMNLRPYLYSSKSRQKHIQTSYQKRSTPTTTKQINSNKQKQKGLQISKDFVSRQSQDVSGLRINLLNKDFLGKIKSPLITATHFLLYDQYNNAYVGQRQTHQRQVASLTKIMTTFVALQLMEKYQLEKQLLIRVSKTAVSLNGTSAKLVEGSFIKLFDLLYATMLPSGNDAAYLLAEVFGLLLFYQNIKPQEKQYQDIQSIDLSYYQNTVTFVNKYIKQMNRKAQQLKMHKTTFANPHGLTNVLNISTAHDIMLLSKHVVQNKEFNKIMSTKEFESELYEQNMKDICAVRQWKNTNRLLDLGWQGIKTGHTNSAGCCLASLKNGIFIVVLNSSSPQNRFQDTIQIYRWYQGYGILSVKNMKQNEKDQNETGNKNDSSEEGSNKQLQTE